MPKRLASGRFYGRMLHKRDVGDLVLADVLYPPGKRLPRHAHERPYFCLVRRGTYTEGYGRRTRVCGPATLVFHPPGELHTEVFGNCSVASFNVEIGPKWLYRMHELGGVLDQPVECHGGKTLDLSFRLFEEFRRADPDSSIAIESITSEILPAFLGRPIDEHHGRPKWLTDARELLEARLEEPLTLREIAAEAGVHPVYLASAFRWLYGCSVGEYIRRLRCELARRMLSNVDVPLSGIALRAGFADQSHLTRAFKRFTGMTPAQYRTFLPFKTS